MYNSSNNELVRTKTLVKNCIVQIDATPFKLWYQKHYNVEIGKKKQGEVKTERKMSKKLNKKIEERKKVRVVDLKVKIVLFYSSKSSSHLEEYSRASPVDPDKVEDATAIF